VAVGHGEEAIDLARIAANIERSTDGIWYARSRSPLSYPERGNQSCFEMEEESFWFRHRNACILDAVRAFPPDGPIFDIGGGNGYVSLALRDGGFPTVLVEPGGDGIRNARRRGVGPLVCAAVEDAGFHPHSLPAAGIFDVLEHIPDDRVLLRTLHHLLAPGGTLYLTVPAYSLLWSDEDAQAGHYRRYTLGQLTRSLAECQFDVLFATYFFSFLPLPIFFQRALPSRLGLRRKGSQRLGAKDHHLPRGWVGRCLGRVMDWERRRLSCGRPLPFGGSCLAVARALAGRESQSS
jgi:SAM-dependent methyltransferase